MFGAVFMASDNVTSPFTLKGKLIYGLCLGIVTFAIRQWGSYAEGVSFALLFMNLWVPFINDWTRQTPYGYVKPAKKAKALTYDGIVELAQKKFKAANITGIKYPIAVNIELSGACEGVFYVYMDEAKIAVEPYLYNDYDVYVRADAETFAKVLEGKMNIYDALSTSDVKIDGLVKKAVLFVHAAF